MGQAGITIAGGAVAGLMLLAAVPAGRVTLGQYAGWGAFADPGEGRCFAIAEPISGRPKGARPALTVARWRRLAGPAQVHARLSRAAATPVLIAGGTRFLLRAEGADLWARDPRDDRRIVAAMRLGGMLAIEGRAAGGRRFRDLYPLEGAASAIDAMRLRCQPD